MTKYLFLCYFGEKRSPLVAEIAREIIHKKKLNIGVNFGAYSSFEKFPKLALNDFKQYDLIFVMESFMKTGLENAGISKNKIICLDLNIDSAEAKDFTSNVKNKLNAIIK